MKLAAQKKGKAPSGRRGVSEGKGARKLYGGDWEVEDHVNTARKAVVGPERKDAAAE